MTGHKGSVETVTSLTPIPPKLEIPLVSSSVSLKSILKMYVLDQSR